MKWVSLASLVLAILFLIGPRMDLPVRESEHVYRGYFFSGPAFLVLLLIAAICGEISLLRRP